VAYFVVLRRTGPQWDPDLPLEQQSGWKIRADFMHALVVDSVDRWTIRLDERRVAR
jgi:hypothetical protein